MPDDTAAPPAWVRDAIFYQIFPDRFAQSAAVPKPSSLQPWEAPPTHHAYKGGDLLGVLERLDYLEELGVNAIYFTPIFKSTANHRYHTYDYYQVDPLLGGNAAFAALLKETRRRDIRIVLDGVFNHTGRGFFQFNDILENGPDSPYLDWFTVKGFPLRAYDGGDGGPNYAAWWNLAALPKLNTDTPAVREFLWDVGQYWVDQGIDGWRLDVPSEIDDDDFWLEFRRRVRTANPEAYIVGEVWGDARRWIRGDQFDAVMNYLFAKACMGFFLADSLDERLTVGLPYAPVPRLDGPAFAGSIADMLSLYPQTNNLVQLNLLDSHDTARFLSLGRGDDRALCLALLFQMTFVGAPCVYYGDEIGMSGGRDPDCRRGMIWDEGQWNTSVLQCYRRLIALRRGRAALRRGDYTGLHARDRVVAFGRRYEAETCVVVVNAGRRPATVDVPLHGYLPDGSQLRDAFTGRSLMVVEGHLPGLSLAPQAGLILDCL